MVVLKRIYKDWLFRLVAIVRIEMDHRVRCYQGVDKRVRIGMLWVGYRQRLLNYSGYDVLCDVYCYFSNSDCMCIILSYIIRRCLGRKSIRVSYPCYLV
jgi:hypothetical protein